MPQLFGNKIIADPVYDNSKPMYRLKVLFIFSQDYNKQNKSSVVPLHYYVSLTTK
jgi:hypothetical protein